MIKTLEDISNSLVNLFDFSINIVFKNIHAFPTIDTAVIPKHLHLQQGNVILDIDNHQWSLFFDDGKYYAARNNIYHAILYDHQNNTWIFGDDPAQDNVHPSSDHFYTRCTVRSIQGASPHKFCRVVAENKLELKEPQPSTVKFTNVNQMDDNEHEAILARFDTGLIKSSPGVEALHFTNHWLIYRIRTIERGLQRFYHAIDINGRLIPARAKKISENRMRCEIYNRKQEEKRYCAEFQYQQWAIERDTSIHISDDLKNIITSDMFTIGIDSQKLSSPDERGIKTNIHGDEFIKFENHFIKIKKDIYGYYLKSKNGVRLNVDYFFGQFRFVNAQKSNRIVTLTPQQYQDGHDDIIISDTGLEQVKNVTLNERWTLLGTNTKASLSEVEHHIGYKIDITFRFQYTTAPFTSFQDLPDLVWFVDKKYKDKNQYSHSGMDMYKQKKSNSIFSIWDAKYIAAYYYSMAGDKNPQYSQVRVFDNEKNHYIILNFPIHM